jgi:predicted nuclease of predicted toxin-antitoxin system
VKVKLDENLPIDAAAVVASFGHDVDTVVGEGLQGADDDTVVNAAAADGRMLFSLDRGLADTRIRPAGSHPGIVALRTGDQATAAVMGVLRTFLENHDIDNMSGCIVVVRGHLVRVRRPEE